MEVTKNKTSKYWLYFAIASVAVLALLFIRPEWFWVALPFQLGYLVKALDVI